MNRRHFPLWTLLGAVLLVALLAFQVFLGAAIIWTRKAVMPTTTHVVSGASVLATSLVIALRARRHLPPAAERAPVTAGAAATA